MSNLISALDNRMNPIVVKELRQGLQSWFIIIIVNLLLVALTLVCLLMVMVNPDITEEAIGGRDMFNVLEVFLFISTILCVPLYVLARLRSERNGLNVDLFFTTSLQPHKIIRGKFIAGMSLVTLLYSICLPFMLFTYILRGYDIPTMLFTLAIGYAAVIPVLMAAIVLGTWTVPRIFAPFVTIAAFFALIPVVWGISGLCVYEILPDGVQYIFRNTEMYWASGAIALGGFLITKLLEAMSIGLLSPPSSNRTCRLRLWMTLSMFIVAAAFTVAGIYVVPYHVTWQEVFLVFAFVWAIISLSVIAIMIIIAICEPDRFSNRIMIQRPRHFLVRLITFLFAHSTSSGLLWATIHVVIIFGSLFTALYLAEHAPGVSLRPYSELRWIREWIPWLVLIFSCIVAYALTAKVIMRTFFRRVSTKHTWVTFLFVFMVFAVSSMVLCFAIDTRHWDDLLFWKFFNPMAASIERDTDVRALVDAAWALGMLALCIPQGLRNAKQYLFEKQKSAKIQGKEVDTLSESLETNNVVAQKE